jgi:anaerobic magnesium-protoporphyrin IX monomethyl ester cyclase
MRVALINPTITSARSARLPLSLLALAGSVEGRCETRIFDGNIDRQYLQTLRRALTESHFDAVGVSVMGGPQVRSAIDTSLAVRAVSPTTPIIWGGYFPSLYTNAAMSAPYVDYAVRGQGEGVFGRLLEAITRGERDNLESIEALSWKRRDQIVHNKDQPFADRRGSGLLPYDILPNPRAYLAHTFLGRRTAAYQAALGCRFRCTFCGVAGMFRGGTTLPPAARLERDLTWLRDHLGADSIQYFDHNFFDREVDMMPLLEVMAKLELPWWCYARADALLNMSEAAWTLVRKSRLRMAYIGAESPNDALLKNIRKGTKSDQTLAVAELCRRQGVTPELSFMVAPPGDPEGETERTFEFIREVKRVNPHSEIVVYIYTPLPSESLPVSARVRAAAAPLLDLEGNPVVFPKTPEQWTEKKWVDYSCHADAPWMSDRLRRRIRDFVTVLGCRFPTVQDARTPAWKKSAVKALASWRYRFRRYDRPWELELYKRVVRPRDPKVAGI